MHLCKEYARGSTTNNRVLDPSSGSLSNDDDGGNENATKQWDY